MDALAKDYIRLCQAIGKQPDMVLLTPIEDALKSLDTQT